MSDTADSKWIRFVEMHVPPKRKTKIFVIFPKDGQQQIGAVAWYGPWRRYAFWPREGSVWEAQCLSDVTAFLNRLMEERKVRRT